jgi:uncharacterized protein YqhQ
MRVWTGFIWLTIVYYLVARSNQYANEPSNSVNCYEFNDELSDSRILVKLVS